MNAIRAYLVNTSCLETFVRSMIATVLMASATFVLGTVVGYQYHVLILRLADGSRAGVEARHRKLVRRWYAGGVALAFGFAFIFDSVPRSNYYLGFILLVVLLWAGWCIHAATAMRMHLADRQWEFVLSCLTLGLISAVSGAMFVEKVFQWLGWRCTE